MYYHNFRALTKRALEPVWREIQEMLGRSPNVFLQERKRMPFWNCFRAQDGYVAIVALTDKQWDQMMRILGREDLRHDRRFSNVIERVVHANDAISAVEEWTSQRTVAEIVKILDDNRIPCGPVQDYDQVNKDAQLESRGMHSEVEHPLFGKIGIPGFPVKISGYDDPYFRPAPELGEHTEEVLLTMLDFTKEEITELRKSGVIR